MSESFEQLESGASAGLGWFNQKALAGAALKQPGRNHRRLIVKAALVEMRGDELLLPKRECVRLLRARVKSRCEQEYGFGPILIIVLTAALYAIVEWIVTYILDHWVHKEGISCGTAAQQAHQLGMAA